MYDNLCAAVHDIVTIILSPTMESYDVVIRMIDQVIQDFTFLCIFCLFCADNLPLRYGARHNGAYPFTTKMADVSDELDPYNPKSKYQEVEKIEGSKD